MYKVQVKATGKIVDFDKYIIQTYVDAIAAQQNVSKAKAKEIFFESLAMNIVREEVLNVVDYISTEK